MKNFQFEKHLQISIPFPGKIAGEAKQTINIYIISQITCHKEKRHRHIFPFDSAL